MPGTSRRKARICGALVVILGLRGLAFAQETPTAAPTRVNWPTYRCHAPEEGKAYAMSERLKERLEATLAIPASDALAILEEMGGEPSRSSTASFVVPYILAWRYHELGRHADLRSAALQVITHPNVGGNQADISWALVAQSYADEEDWPHVVELLQPMVDAKCRPLEDAVRKLLAVARIRMEQYSAALEQFDNSCMADVPAELHWIRIALEVDCKLNGPEACVRRILRYSEKSGASDDLQSILNTALNQLQMVAEAKPFLDDARESGKLSSDYAVVIRRTATNEPLTPLQRIAPEYPRAAAQAGQSGYVVMQVTVGADGNVIEATPVESSPPGVFEEASIKAALKGRFKPQLIDGQPHITQGQYTVRFNIDEPRDSASRARASRSASRVAAPASAPDAHPFVPRCR